MKKWKIEIDTGLEVRETFTDDYESALRIYEGVKETAKTRGISCNVSLYGDDVLMETDTVNPSRVIVIH